MVRYDSPSGVGNLVLDAGGKGLIVHFDPALAIGAGLGQSHFEFIHIAGRRPTQLLPVAIEDRIVTGAVKSLSVGGPVDRATEVGTGCLQAADSRLALFIVRP